MTDNKSQIEATPSVIPRDAVATPDDVQKALKLTPEQLDELRRDQKLALYRSRARLSDNERRIARGIELERHHRKSGDLDGLAEALRMQGRYEEAAESAISKDLKRECKELAGAVSKNDGPCGCDPFTGTGEYNLPNQYIECYGHSDKHNSEMPFVRCTRCGELNAKPAPQHLLTQRDVRHGDASDKEKLSFFKN